MIKLSFADQLVVQEISKVCVPAGYFEVASCTVENEVLKIYCDKQYYNNDAFVKVFESKNADTYLTDPFFEKLPFFGYIQIGWPRYLMKENGTITVSSLKKLLVQYQESIKTQINERTINTLKKTDHDSENENSCLTEDDYVENDLSDSSEEYVSEEITPNKTGEESESEQDSSD